MPEEKLHGEDTHARPPLISSDVWHLLGFIVTPFPLTVIFVSLSYWLMGPDRSWFFLESAIHTPPFPYYDPLGLHIGDVYATFAVASFMVFMAGMRMGPVLFALFYVGNLAKIYVLQEHFVHYDIWRLGELWAGTGWGDRSGLIVLGMVLGIACYRFASRRLVYTRLFFIGCFMAAAMAGLSDPPQTVKTLWEHQWLHVRTCDPYCMMAVNGPVMAIALYELNHRQMLTALKDAPEKPPARPDFDFRNIPAAQVVHKPNIYILMLESYLDPYYFHKLHFSVPPVGGIFADEIGQSDTSAFYTIRATAAAEFEVLCGLPNQQTYTSKIFDLLLRHGQSLECLPNYLKKLGYATIASHPNVATMYNRGNAYPIVGFERVIFSPQLDMSDRDSVWLSDRSFLQQNLELVRKQLQTHQPFLNYVMTTGGHYPYKLNDKRLPMLKTDPAFSSMGAAALQLSYYTARAVSDYLQALRTLDPNALVVIMGDHFPYFINEDDALIAWAKEHETVSGRSFTPVHRLGNLDHQTFGMVMYRGHILPQPHFEQFETSTILTDIMTGGQWCREHHCPQQQPFMLIGDSIADRSNPIADYCSADAPATHSCDKAKKLQQAYLLMYQQMLYPFF